MLRYRLAAAARADIVDLLTLTEARFGELARRRYEALLTTALQDIATDPKRIGSIERPELGKRVRSYHLRHSRKRAGEWAGIVRRPRHILLYRVEQTDVEVGRVLHDAMEIERHLPVGYGDE